jgi:hypothetical protein
MMLAYARTNRSSYSLDSFKALMGFASIFRMDSPLVAWGSGVYQPSEPINTVVDMWAIPAALIRGLWGPAYFADSLVLTPSLPGNISSIALKFPLVWGDKLIFLSAVGTGPISGVTVDGSPLQASLWTPQNATLLWDALPSGPNTVMVAFTFGTSRNGHAEARAHEEEEPAVVPTSKSQVSIDAAIRALRMIAVLPATPILWLDATAIPGAVPGSRVSVWPDISGSGANASQPIEALQPVFNPTGMAGRPSVDFDGQSTFLAGTSLALPAQSTIVAVVSNARVPPQSTCCNGIFFSEGGCNGLGMKVVASTSDDDYNATVLMIDWSGSPDSGTDDLTGREVCIL